MAFKCGLDKWRGRSSSRKPIPFRKSGKVTTLTFKVTSAPAPSKNLHGSPPSLRGALLKKPCCSDFLHARFGLRRGCCLNVGAARRLRRAFWRLGGALWPYASGARETRTCSSKVEFCPLQNMVFQRPPSNRIRGSPKLNISGLPGAHFGTPKCTFLDFGRLGPKWARNQKSRAFILPSLRICTG